MDRRCATFISKIRTTGDWSAQKRSCVGHHQKYESDAALFVCYHAVTALTERFCQNAEIRPVRLAPSPSRRLRLTHGRARQEQLVGGQVGPASRKPCTQAPSFGHCLDVALRSLSPGTGFRCSSLLAHAILFLGLHDGIPAATSPSNQSENMPARCAFGRSDQRLQSSSASRFMAGALGF